MNFGMSGKDSIKNVRIRVLNLVGLDESYLERSPFRLSGGQKRRVGYCRYTCNGGQIYSCTR